MSRLVERLVGRPLTDEEKLTAGVVLTLTFMVFEGAFAIVAGSLAMLGGNARARDRLVRAAGQTDETLHARAVVIREHCDRS